VHTRGIGVRRRAALVGGGPRTGRAGGGAGDRRREGERRTGEKGGGGETADDSVREHGVLRGSGVAGGRRLPSPSGSGIRASSDEREVSVRGAVPGRGPCG